MRMALCNEVVRELPFEKQCALAAGLGYRALEIAPFTLGEEPHRLDAATIARLRRTAESAGIAISGLHWLLVTPPGLSITSADAEVRARTVALMERLVALCAELGGGYLVHGSPAQRMLEPGREAEGRAHARECLARAARAAERAGVTYCLEPLSPEETNFVNSVEEAVAIVREIGSPALRTMLDHRAACLAERETPAELLERWLPGGMIAHVHLNDRNKGAPGQGEDRFAPVLATLSRHAYAGTLGIEPFLYRPDGPTCAARAIGYLCGILETLR